MTTRIPPAALEILLHIYYSPSPHPMEGTQVYADWTRWFKANELIEPDPEEACAIFRITERGKAMVEMLCTTPLPEKHTAWVDPREGKVIAHGPWCVPHCS